MLYAECRRRLIQHEETCLLRYAKVGLAFIQQKDRAVIFADMRNTKSRQGRFASRSGDSRLSVRYAVSSPGQRKRDVSPQPPCSAGKVLLHRGTKGEKGPGCVKGSSPHRPHPAKRLPTRHLTVCLEDIDKTGPKTESQRLQYPRLGNTRSTPEASGPNNHLQECEQGDS